MKRFLFIDDVREHFFNETIGLVDVARTYNQAIEFLNIKYYDVVSFDHDLGEEKTGYDIAKYIIENQIQIGSFYIHSANPVGRKNIEELLLHYGYAPY